MKALLGIVLLAFGCSALAADNAAFVSQTPPPSTTVPGQSYAVSITMQNTGDSTWTVGTYRLGSDGPQNNTTWGPSRVELASAVAPGQNATFSFNITAPSEFGSYTYKWRMVRDDTSAWFGALSAYVIVQNGVNASQFISHTMPASTTPGGTTYPVTVTMRNTGTTTWKSSTGYRLGSLDPLGYWQVAEAALPNDVAPNVEVTFSFTLTSPEAWGTYPVRYVMRKGEPYGWFGPMTTGNIVNGVNQSEFVLQSVPASMTAGGTYPVSVTFRNISGTNWTASNTYGLGAIVPWGTNPWGITRVALPTAVAPNDTVTFNFNVTAPTAPGTYNFQWKMLRDEINSWFGAVSTVVPVSVQAANTLYFLHADHLNTPRLITNQAQQVVWRHDQAEPFGNNPPDENPSSLGVFEFPLRDEGTYADKETNLVYNWNRYRDPNDGRFIQADPLGLRGGDLSLYVLRKNNPLSFTDPMGLAVWMCTRKLDAAVPGNHTYLWDDTTNKCCGRVPGADPLRDCKEKGPGTDFCVRVAGSDGKESEMLKCCDVRARRGRYIPFYNDCVNTAEDCITQSGLKVPQGATGGSRTGSCSSCFSPQDPPLPQVP